MPLDWGSFIDEWGLPKGFRTRALTLCTLRFG